MYELCADNGCFKKDSIGDMGDTIESITHYIDHTKYVFCRSSFFFFFNFTGLSRKTQKNFHFSFFISLVCGLRLA